VTRRFDGVLRKDGCRRRDRYTNLSQRETAKREVLAKEFDDASRGRANELRALRAAEQLMAQFDWLRSVRASTLAEDMAGVDLVAETDVGTVELQVKSSFAGAAEFRRLRPELKHVRVVVAHEDDAVFRGRMGVALHLARQALLSQGANHGA